MSDKDTVRSAVVGYQRRFPRLRQAGGAWLALVTDLLDEAGINYLTITGRTKSVASYAEKVSRTAGGALVYPDPDRDITDLIGVRVITFLQSDVAAVAGVLADQLHVISDLDMGQETARQGRFGYASRHLMVEPDPAHPLRSDRGDVALLSEAPASVQIRTVLQHAWAEFEHEVRYKGTIPTEQRPELDRRFTLAAGLLELADAQFSQIRDTLASAGTQPQQRSDGDPRIGSRELAAFLFGQYPDAAWSRTDHYGWISGLLLELGIASLGELSQVLQQVDDAAIAEHMAYKYPPGAVRRLDDALLWTYGQRYIDLTGNSHRLDLLTTRLQRLRPDTSGTS